MKRILIDTDVIMDFFFDRAPYWDDAEEILSLFESRETKGHITSLIICNVHYQLQQTSMIEKLLQLLTITEVLSTDKNVIPIAMNSKFRDFKDALQNYSAERDGQIDLILKRNIKGFKNSSLAIMTPTNYLKTTIARR